jgi:hypothetical protein
MSINNLKNSSILGFKKKTTRNSGPSSLTCYGGDAVNTYTQSDGATYKAHVFTTDGLFETIQPVSIEYFLVAGGGGGGIQNNTESGGGGGAGGYLTGAINLSPGFYTIKIGGGGRTELAVGGTRAGYAGQPTTLSGFGDYSNLTLTAVGGGAGGAGGTGGAGGSGGGGSGNGSLAGGAGTAGPPQQGFAGGSSGGVGSSGGGGGGATSAGVSQGGGGTGISTVFANGTSATYCGGGGTSGGGTAAGTFGTGGRGGNGSGGGGQVSGTNGVAIIRYRIA